MKPKFKNSAKSIKDAKPKQINQNPMVEGIQKTQKDRELWEAFNLAEKNPDRGGGILYCIRYGSDRLKAQQDIVISKLQAMSVEIIEVENQLGIKIKPGMTKSERETMLIMLEELSVVNEALEYGGVGLGNMGSLDMLKNALVGSYFNLLGRDKVAAYDIVDMVIPEIVSDIRHAEKQGKVLSSAERKILDDLAGFAARQVENMNGTQVLFGDMQLIS